MQKPDRYHPLIITLHWLVAILTFSNLLLGLIVFQNRNLPNPVGIHMLFGLGILLMILVRFSARFLTRRPPDATTGSRSLDLLAKLVHYGLYINLALITIIGLLMSLRTGQLQFTFFSGTALGNIDFLGIPLRILGVPLRVIHRYSALTLLGLVTLHVSAALYHQFLRRDNLLARMWYGKKKNSQIKRYA